MIKRLVEENFNNWKDSKSNTALVVTGARQVGKTYSILNFLHKNFEHVVHIDLTAEPDIARSFETATSPESLLERISLFANGDMVPGKTAVFIDEIQESGNAFTLLKYLVQRQDYRYVASGSLLGVELQNIRSLPVGYVSLVEMYPLDFFEFCRANGINDTSWKKLEHYFDTKEEVPDYMHDYFLDLFHKYLAIGGMPAAVQEYITTHNIGSVREIQQNIVSLYRADISKYVETKNQLYIKDIYDKAPANLDNQSKRFNLASLKKGSTIDDYRSDFVWLVNSGVCIASYNVTEPKRPLILNENSSYFKLFLNDVGLLMSQCDIDVVRSTNLESFEINYGSIYENAVAQELVCHNYDPYYFRNKSLGELDFVIEYKGRVLPLEIKSGKHYKRHSAINNALKTPNYDINEAYVFTENNIEVADKITYFPIYMIDFIRKGD